jgi:hypothetical protein
LCGPAYRKIAVPGHGLVRPASSPKSPATQLLLWEISRCHLTNFFTST